MVKLSIDTDGVTLEKMADDSVGAAEIIDDSVGVAEIGNDAVGSAEIIDGSVAKIDIKTDEVQVRVAGTCLAGQAISQVEEDGGVQCVDAADGIVAPELVTVAPTNGAPVEEFTTGQDLFFCALTKVVTDGLNAAVRCEVSQPSEDAMGRGKLTTECAPFTSCECQMICFASSM
jgi:hypothetical protein